MSKIIIGLVGEMACGKSTVTEYIKKNYSAVSFRFSDMLRDVLKRIHIENNRSNLQTLSTILRQNFSEDLMSQVIASDVMESTENFIITEGIRRPTDITFLKQMPGFHIIAIQADEKTRFERITKRSENPDDQNKTWEQFQLDGKQESEQKIKEIAADADDSIDNNGSVEELYKQIDAIIAKYQ